MHVTRFGRLLALQLLLGIVALAVLFARNDLLHALRGLPHLRLEWAFAALLIFSASKLLQGLRWKFLLRHRPGLPVGGLLGLFLFSNFLNAVVPLRVGDLVRIELPSRRYGVPRAELASNVVIVESLFDGVSYVLLMMASLLLIDIPPTLRPTLLIGAVAILGLSAFVASAARGGWTWDPGTARLVRRLPRRFRVQMARRVGDVIAGMASLRSTRDVGIGIVLSVIGWLLEVLVYWLLARAFTLHMSFAQTLLVTVAANLATAIPLTPWNVGPYELAVTELLVLLGAERGAVGQYAVGSHVLLMIWISFTGIVAMLTLRLSLDDLRTRARELPRAIEADHHRSRREQ